MIFHISQPDPICMSPKAHVPKICRLPDERDPLSRYQNIAFAGWCSLRESPCLAVIISATSRIFWVLGCLGLTTTTPGWSQNSPTEAIIATPETADETIVQENNKVELVDDASLDEAIDRRPDLAFSNVSLDQENSGISLSTIPAQAVEKAEVLKAATPDLDADTRGAILRVKYRPGYELEERLVSGRIYTRYKGIYDSWGALGDFSWAQRIGENAGIRATIEADSIERGSDVMDFNWSERTADATGLPWVNRINLNNSRQDWTTWRFNSSADYRFDKNNDIYLRLAYESEQIEGISSSVQYRYGDEEDFSSLTADEGTTADGRLVRVASHWEEEAEELSVTLGGNNLAGPVELEWRTQHVSETEGEPFDRDVRYSREGITFGYRDARGRYPEIVVPEIDDPGLYPLESYDNSTQDEEETTSVAAIDLKWEDGFLGKGDYLKIGAKYSRDDREIVRRLQAFDAASPDALRLADFQSPFTRDDFIGRGFSPGAVPDAEATAAFVAANPSTVVLDPVLSALRSDPGSYEVQQDVTAAYTMINWQGERLRVVAGLRFEDTQLSATGNEVIVEGDEITVVSNTAGNGYEQVFPGLHMRYELSPSLTLFGSTTKTIQRPNFSYTAPFRVIDIEDSEIFEGTPSLRATLYQNYDLSLDYQPNEDLLISGEVFYRDVTDPVYRQSIFIPDGQFAGYQRDQLLNGEPSTRQGAKLILQQQLGALAEQLSAWSWSFAYTYTETEASYPQRPDEVLPLINAPTDRIDGTLSYRGDRAFVQLGVDYRSRMLHRVGETGPVQDQFERSRLSLNVKAEHKVNERLTAFVDWENILGEFERDITESPERLSRYFQHDPWIVLAGMRFKL